jgi:hypothetical protein
LQRLVIFGHIGVKLDPGLPPRYRRADVERLAQIKAKPVRRCKLRPALAGA